MSKEPCDVFISSLPDDRDIASRLTSTLAADGLVGKAMHDVPTDEDLEKIVWEALAECNAFVFILPTEEISPSMWVEVGAAWAWHKPIFVVSESQTAKIPVSLKNYPVYVASATDEILREIRKANAKFSTEDEAALTELYVETAVPVDQLIVQPARLLTFAQEFERRTHKRYTSKILLSTLLRLRKQGRLSAIRKSTRLPEGNAS